MPLAPGVITVLLNAEREAMLRGYTQGDRLINVWRELFTYETEATNFTKEADDMFEFFNRDNRPGGAAHRSMSVGDVVLIETPFGRNALAVANLGFAPVNVGLLIEHAVMP